MPGYNPQAIEKKWQERWAAAKVFAAKNVDAGKPKFYVLDMFPYPSGQGLHVGHPEGYTATDIVARYKRARGFAVMHPMGWDAFGLPAEQYAIKNNVHPRETTANNVNRFRTQLQSLGFSYDWDREVDTTDPMYYKWSQWIFLKLYDTWFDAEAQRGRPIGELVEEFRSGKRSGQWNVGSGRNRGWDDLSAAEQRKVLADYRLAYEAEVPVNWCQGLGTVLANEEVIDGKSEVGGFPVERKPMRQWMLRITAYSERLIAGLEKLAWSDSLKEMQRNWIGKSEGAEVAFKIETIDCDESQGSASIDFDPLKVFTTRPDTLFGATYMVIAPEHELANAATKLHHAWPHKTPDSWTGTMATPREAVKSYQAYAASRSDRERQEDTKKTGVFTGFYAINPVNDARIPIFISDYVLMGYGTGAIMAVPGHDERDHEFAFKFKLPIVQVVASRKDASAIDIQKEAFVEEGVAVNSHWIEGLPTAEAKSKIIGRLESKGIGTKRVNYKIRDWLFSRQRYWGEPFPVVHLEDGTHVRLADSELPLRLPELEDFKPTGTIDPPLSKAKEWWNVHVLVDGNHEARVVPAGTAGAVKARRELNTMPQWAGSCWYYIRYVDPRNDKAFVDPAAENYWLHDGVDLYVGGVEHAVLHLLYSRFWHKVLFDWGLVSCDEPFRRLVNQGMVLGEIEHTAFKTDAGAFVSLQHVDEVWGTRVVDGKTQTISRDVRNNELVIGVRMAVDEVEKRGDVFVLKADSSVRVDARSFKMSKSRDNVVSSDSMVNAYGADSLRLFEMFMGPLEQVKPWSTAGVEGVYRFLQRVWRNMIDPDIADPNAANKLLERHPEGKTDTWWTVSGDLPQEQHAAAEADYQAIQRPLHRMIKKVTEDIEKLSFNTAIAAMMEFNNQLTKTKHITLETAETFLRVLEPFAPHFADEVLSIIHTDKISISQRPWPAYDPAMLVEATVEIPVQVNGKLRGRVTVANDADEATVIAAALADAEVQKSLAGKEPKKKIYVKGRMVNLVV